MRRPREETFLLVDLYSQREAVAQHVRGWSVSSVLDWMGQFGTIEAVPTYDDDGLYVFRSKWGMLRTSFYLTKKRGLVVMSPGKLRSHQPC